METDRAKGTWVDPSKGRTALDTYAWAWLRGHARLAKRTREIYETQLRLHILPVIDPVIPARGSVALGDLTPEVVRQWYAAPSSTEVGLWQPRRTPGCARS